MAVTTARTVRVPDAVWNGASNRAHQERTTVTAVVVNALRDYADAGDPPPAHQQTLEWTPADGKILLVLTVWDRPAGAPYAKELTRTVLAAMDRDQVTRHAADALTATLQ